MVSNFAQQLPTTRNNMQQGVQTDATCNMQKFWELMASKVASDGMGFNFIRKRIFFLRCGRHTKSLCLLESKRSALKISWWQDKRENRCVTFLTCSPFTTMLTNQNRDERKFCRHSRWKNVEIDSKKTFRLTPKLLYYYTLLLLLYVGSSGHKKKRAREKWAKGRTGAREGATRARSLFRPLLPSACYAG